MPDASTAFDLPPGFSASPPDEATLSQVRKRESYGGQNLPPQANYAYPSSHASGAYQFQPGTWRDLTKKYGVGTEYSEAYQAPFDVQTYIAYRADREYGPNSKYTWSASAPPGGYRGGSQPASKWDLPPGFSATPPKPLTGAPGSTFKWGTSSLTVGGPKPAAQALAAGTDLPPGWSKTKPLPPGPMDPSIVAQQKTQMGDREKKAQSIPSMLPPAVGEAAGAEGQAMQTAPGAAAAAWLGKKATEGYQWVRHLSPELLSDVIDKAFSKGAEAVHNELAQQLKDAGVPAGDAETQAHQATDFIMNVPMALIGSGVELPGAREPSPAGTVVKRAEEGTDWRGVKVEPPQAEVLPSHRSLGISDDIFQRMFQDGPTHWRDRLRDEPWLRTQTPFESPYTVEQLAELEGKLYGPAVKIESPAVKVAEDTVAEVPNHPFLHRQGLTSEGKFPNHPFLHRQGIKGEDGFLTSEGKFVNRQEARPIAEAAGQLKPGAGKNLHTEDLQNVPQAHPVGAEATGKAVRDAYMAVPPKPTTEFIRSTDDSFFRLRGAAIADKAQFRQWIKSLPPDLKAGWFPWSAQSKIARAFQERTYRYMEAMENGDPAPKDWTLQDQDLYDKYFKPWVDEQSDLYGEIKKISPKIAEDFSPHIHRMVVGKTKEIDPWMGEAGEAANPISGYRSRSASSLKERVYYAIESEKGTRKLVAMTDHGPMVIEGGQSIPLARYQGEATKVGDKFKVNGENWEVKQARTAEIESQTSTRYHKNAMASTIKNVIQLRAVARALNELERLKATPEWAQYTIKLREGANVPGDWKTVSFPPFYGYAFEPKFANVIEDFWTYKKPALGEKIAGITRFAVQSLFWNPIVHGANVAYHWATARGWDWLHPIIMAKLPMRMARSVLEVTTQGSKYQQLLREGSGLIYGSVANEEFYRVILKTFGESVKREPWKWDPVARAMGVGPSDLVKMLYGASSRALWSVSDMLMMERVLELEDKGMSTRAAIAEAERHIPNYRIPPEVLKSRIFAQALKDPSLTAFSRYHYGMFKSYGEMAKDLAGPHATLKQRWDAMGNIFATALLMTVVTPMINRKIQQMTGDKNIEMGPRGSTTIAQEAFDMWRGKPIEQVIQNSITLTPVVRFGLEVYSGADLFTHKPLIEPSDLQHHRWGRIAGEAAESTAEHMIAPYAAVQQAIGSKQPLKVAGSEALGGLVKQGLGLRKPFKPFKSKSQEREAGRRWSKLRKEWDNLERGAQEYLNAPPNR